MLKVIVFTMVVCSQAIAGLDQYRAQVEAGTDLESVKADLISQVDKGGDAETLALLVEVFFLTEDHRVGLDYAKKALAASPKNPQLHFYFAMLVSARCQEQKMRWMLEKGTYLKHLETAIKLDPAFLSPYYGLIGWHAKAPGFIGASKETALQWADRLAEEDPLAGGLQRIMVYGESERFEDAEAMYRQLLAGPYDAVRVRREFGAFLVQQKRYSEAHKLLAQNGEDLQSLYQSAKARILGRFEVAEAVSDLDHFIRADHQLERPSKAGAWWRKGQAFEILKDQKQALACYRQAVSMAPDFAKAQEDLARLEK